MRSKALRNTAVVLLASGGLLIASGCSSSTSSSDSSAKPNAVANNNCASYPPPIPQTPTDPTHPYGPPEQASSLANTQTQVIAAAQAPEYSKEAYLCAQGAQAESLATCSQDYWNFYGSPNGKPQDECNFFYLRTANDYWSGLTPLLLNQYSDYLKIHADGDNAPNLAAGPHATLETYDGTVVGVPAWRTPGANFTLTDGKLNGANVAAAILPLLQGTQGATDPKSGSVAPIMPALASDQMTLNCTDQVYVQQPDYSWKQTPIDQVPVAAKTNLACTANTKDQGTAFVTAFLGTPTATSVPAQISISMAATQANALRRDPSRPFTTDNVIWPVELPEVQNQTPMPFTIQQGNVCKDKDGKATSCLHLWVTKASQKGGTFQQCQLWFTMEIDSPAARDTLTKYGAKFDSAMHISLATSGLLKGEDAATYCQRAATLNQQSGINPLGNPAPSFVNKLAQEPQVLARSS